jgi:hypothetical protein
MGLLTGGKVIAEDFRPTVSEALGSPAAASSTAVRAAAGAGTYATGITNPDVPRNVTATPSGTAGNVLAVQVVVAGTDTRGNAITETLPAFTAGSLAAVTGSKAFRTITSVSIPAAGTGITVAIGSGTKLGLPHRLSRDTILNAYLGGVRESTRPTVAFDGTNWCNNTVVLNSTPNGNAVIVDFYLP